ncbi:hypothetical protein BN940_12091 [Castellaniella defragrans 65Phen]|uniref:FecR N-terminal domain-containing protein n=1 Tax=Castellaniella defragrans (strain DSM 12143 / CCUG 39792 / 65Phen) TaxID=1437824 RepID=W8X9I3_CASD6|nr:hypothetical protein BN940_12091 [Castellaniella defragrans 65Phen]
MRGKSEGMDEAERRRFEAWLRASSEHAREYRRAQGLRD